MLAEGQLGDAQRGLGHRLGLLQRRHLGREQGERVFEVLDTEPDIAIVEFVLNDRAYCGHADIQLEACVVYDNGEENK